VTLIKEIMRDLLGMLYPLAVALPIGKWALDLAYLERGYEAVGSEYCLAIAVYWLAYRAVQYLFDEMEEIGYGRNRKERGS